MKKEKTYTEQQLLFLDALPKHKGDVRLAMNEAGYSEKTPVNYIIKSLADEIIEISKNLLAANSVKAVNSLVDVLDNKGTAVGSAHIINAAKALLDKAGAARTEENIQLNVGAGLLILPAKQKDTEDEVEGT